MSVLITGASGFIGSRACFQFTRNGFDVIATSRSLNSFNPNIKNIIIPFIDSSTDWSSALHNVDSVVHLAGRAHVLRDSELDPLSVYRQVNVDGTIALAMQAAQTGCRRFIFVSSIKVSGEHTSNSKPFKATDPPMPIDAYGVSKYEAELGLMNIANSSSMEIVIVRPPLVYGPGVKGNFRTLIKLLAAGIPLPFANIINNRRSLISVDNLVDFLGHCISCPVESNGVFLVSDNDDVSTAELLIKLGNAIGHSARLFPLPSGFLETASILLRRRDLYQKMCSSLIVDSTPAQSLLGWSPPNSFDEGLLSLVNDIAK